MSYTYSQQVVLALLPKFTSVIGIACASFIISEIINDHKKNEGNPIKRALFAVCVYEIIDAIGWFLSSWVMPSETDFAFSIGTQGSCSFQGYLLQLAIGGPIAYSMLAYFFYLVVRCGYTTEMLENIEMKLHTVTHVYAAGSATLMLFLGLYNPVTQVCYVIGHPVGCGDSSFEGSDVPCERGDHAYKYGLIFFYLLLWMVIIFITFLNLSMRNALLKANSEDVSWITNQALYYSLAFIVTWIPSTLWSVFSWTAGGGYWLDMMAGICEPLAGFFNLLIFLRNRPDSILKLKQIFCLVKIGDENESDYSSNENKIDPNSIAVANEGELDLTETSRTKEG